MTANIVKTFGNGKQILQKVENKFILSKTVQLREYMLVLTELHELEFRDLPAIGEDDGVPFSGWGEAGNA